MSKNKVTNVKIGSDPEIFLFSESKNKFVPVCGLVGGTKDEPIPVTDDGFSLQEDNVMLEYTIAPSKTREEWVNNINFAKEYIKETVLKPLGLVPKYQAAAFFEFEDLDNEAAQTFGCSPDYNAWTLEQNEVKSDNPLKRTAGKHVHIGYDNPDLDVNIDLIKAMDLFLGVPSVLLDPDTERRKVYGKAGAYRFKKYGVEYRVLSAYFQKNDELIGWVYDNTMAAIEFVNMGGIITNDQEIQDCINNCDKALALEIIEDYKINMIEIKSKKAAIAVED